MIERLFKALAGVPSDKVLHFAYGVVIAVAGLSISGFMSFWLVVLAAVGKEIYDGTLGKAHGHAADPWDVFATVLGGALIWIAFLVGGMA